ncbi:MAG TPA: aminotransferase class I/II-fold pyridoxal phosphate-dependent enzyme [Clostridia bacterium]|nr:aminotransferase class I/II-fold pyridoxal phosphate-dependent enzyme [Clostridia bacterium]
MRLPDFLLERYFAKYEFSAPYLLCCSDCESFTVEDLLSLEPDASERFKKQRLGYSESLGDPELRRLVSGLFQRVPPDGILITSGAEEAIFLFMNAALTENDHVIVLFPCYQSLFSVASSIGCRMTKWEVKRSGDGWALDLDFLYDSIGPDTKALIVNFPHNPTGLLPSRREFDAIIDLVREKNILLLSDEVYRLLEYDPADRLPPAADLYENAVSICVLSKSYGLAGLRIGWTATRNAGLFKSMASMRDYTTICNSAPSEFLAKVALRNADTLLGRNLSIVRHNLCILDEFFAKHSHLFDWLKPKAGPIAFPRIRWGTDVEDFCIDLVEKKGVLLLPGKYYDYPGGHFRIGFGRKNMPESLERLAEYL